MGDSDASAMQFGGLNLLCTETDVILRAVDDSVLMKDQRILSNLLLMESEYLPSANYYSIQLEVKPYMRRELTQWMLDVCKEERCEREVFVLAVNYLDRFLSLVPMKKSQLQLLATTALFIASKLKDNRPFVAHHLVEYTECYVTVMDLLEWEFAVLQTLSWDISVPTAYVFVEQILIRLDLPQDQRKLIQNYVDVFIDFSMTELKFSALRPSLIAVVAIHTALTWPGIPLGKDLNTQNMLTKIQEIIAVEMNFLQPYMKQLKQLLLNKGFSADKNSDEHESMCCEWESASSKSDHITLTPTDLGNIVLVQ